jgi:hypothetical protein
LGLWGIHLRKPDDAVLVGLLGGRLLNTAFERRVNTLTGFKDFHLKDKARIWL